MEERAPRGRPSFSGAKASISRQKANKYNKKTNKQRVFIGNQDLRWKELKDKLGCSNPNLARVLLDSYMEAQRDFHSTPLASPIRPQPCVADIDERCTYDDDGDDDKEETWEDISISDKDPYGFLLAEENAADTSWNPDGESDSSVCDSSSDSEEETVEDEEDQVIHEADTPPQKDEDVGIAEISYPGSPIIQTAEEVFKQSTTLAYENQIISLARLPAINTCNKCQEGIEIKTSKVGTAMYLHWTCKMGHQLGTWCSQPKLSSWGVHAGDVEVSVNTVLSGNNFAKIRLFTDFTRLGCTNEKLHFQIQRLYTVPAIETVWQEQMDDVRSQFRDKEVILSGDGRCDSPGHSAQYCTYTVMDHDSNTVLDMVTIDKREVDMKSSCMEKKGLEDCLATVQGAGVLIKEVVTDGHVQIQAMFKTQPYSHIQHQKDVWHGSKNLVKKLNECAKKSECRDLQDWIPDLNRHFWYCAEMAQGDHEKFVMMWTSCIKHVVNCHEWLLDSGGRCDHKPLTEEEQAAKKWLKAGSAAHLALIEVALSPRFLRDLPYYVNFRHTGMIEVLNHLILSYASKQYAYTPPVYKARCHLAALDFMANKDRCVVVKDDGSDRLHKNFSQRGKRFYVNSVKEAKKYPHILTIQRKVVTSKLQDKHGLRRNVNWPANDPRRTGSLGQNICGANPSTEEVASQQVSRFKSLEG